MNTADRARLRAVDRQALRFALRLAIQWEESFIQSCEPSYGKIGHEERIEQAKSRRNIKKFQRLIEVLR
jgi:hypothetical protein